MKYVLIALGIILSIIGITLVSNSLPPNNPNEIQAVAGCVMTFLGVLIFGVVE